MSGVPLMRRVLFAAALGVLAVLAAVAAWLAWRSAAGPHGPAPTAAAAHPDPRRTYTGPYRNINPDVQYVGDAQCVGCHEDIAKSYALHPMGRSLAPIADETARQPPPCLTGRGGEAIPDDAHNPFMTFGRRFRMERQGERAWHRQTAFDESGKPVVEWAQEVRWAIGSGMKGRSYLTEQDGYLLQTPISWFAPTRPFPPTGKGRVEGWDLSPGFGPAVLAGRLVPASCLVCHANRVREDADHPDRFEPPVFEGCAIGCERCHGPGELHVRREGANTIINPAKLSPDLRDAVCEQCHLEGEARVLRAGRGLQDFRPGLPLCDFWAILVQ